MCNNFFASAWKYCSFPCDWVVSCDVIDVTCNKRKLESRVFEVRLILDNYVLALDSVTVDFD